MKKFIGFSMDPLRPIDLSDKSKWAQEGNSRSYKLINPDLDKDRQFATAEIKIKAASTKGYDPVKRLYIAGVANANIVDRMQERLDPVGLDITNYLKNRQLLAHHSYYHPIGQVEELSVQEDGVYFIAWIGDPELAELTEMQREIRSLVAQGILRTVSVGFIPKKIKAPLFGQNGELQEPAVIEQWELLELSVVAVPCNQDSTFEVKNFAKSFGDAKVKTTSPKSQSLNETVVEFKKSLAQDSTEVQTLIFDKKVFNRDDAVAWVKDHEFVVDGVDENEESYLIRQKDRSLFDEDSFKTIDITTGVRAVAGKITKADAPADSQPAEPQDGEMLTLMRGIDATCQKIYQACDSMMQKMDVKPADEAPAPASESSAEESQIEKRVTGIEKGMERIAQALKLIADKVK